MGRVDVLIHPALTFPDASNTGPSGALSAYSGSTFFGSGETTISNQVIGTALAPVGITVASTGILHLVNCYLYGIIGCSDLTASFDCTDCTLDGGVFEGPVVGYYNYTLTRCNVTGGKDSCNMAQNITLRDSYFHNQYIAPSSTAHSNGIICSGGNTILVDHCNVGCDSNIGTADGGPTASISLFGDFAQLDSITVQNSLIRGCTNGPFAAYWGWEPGKSFPIPTNIRALNNAYTKLANGKGGAFGTNSSWFTDPGNVYSGGYWLDTGLPVLVTD